MIYVERSRPAPKCLAEEKRKRAGKYDCGDVRERLKQDFRNKCYLCENTNPIPSNIEHFVPCGDDRNLKFDWNNLFFSCGHCNSVKGSRFNNHKSDKPIYILDCSEKTDEVDASIKYDCEGDVFAGMKVKLTPLKNHDKVLNTVKLLREIYNAERESGERPPTARQIIDAESLRENLLNEIAAFRRFIKKYYKHKTKYGNKIKRALGPASAFTAFKRWIVRDNDALNREFKDFLKD